MCWDVVFYLENKIIWRKNTLTSCSSELETLWTHSISYFLSWVQFFFHYFFCILNKFNLIHFIFLFLYVYYLYIHRLFLILSYAVLCYALLCFAMHGIWLWLVYDIIYSGLLVYQLSLFNFSTILYDVVVSMLLL